MGQWLIKPSFDLFLLRTFEKLFCLVFIMNNIRVSIRFLLRWFNKIVCIYGFHCLERSGSDNVLSTMAIAVFSQSGPLALLLRLLLKYNALQLSCYLFSSLAQAFPEYQKIWSRNMFYRPSKT